MKVRVADDSQAVAWNDKEYFKGTGIARVTWMQWLSPARLAVETNRTSLYMRDRPVGAIYVFDSDGKNARELFSAKGPSGNVGKRGHFITAIRDFSGWCPGWDSNPHFLTEHGF